MQSTVNWEGAAVTAQLVDIIVSVDDMSPSVLGVHMLRGSNIDVDHYFVVAKIRTGFYTAKYANNYKEDSTLRSYEYNRKLNGFQLELHSCSLTHSLWQHSLATRYKRTVHFMLLTYSCKRNYWFSESSNKLILSDLTALSILHMPRSCLFQNDTLWWSHWTDLSEICRETVKKWYKINFFCSGRRHFVKKFVSNICVESDIATLF